jgi:hypothetical protein
VRVFYEQYTYGVSLARNIKARKQYDDVGSAERLSQPREPSGTYEFNPAFVADLAAPGAEWKRYPVLRAEQEAPSQPVHRGRWASLTLEQRPCFQNFKVKRYGLGALHCPHHEFNPDWRCIAGGLSILNDT